MLLFITLLSFYATQALAAAPPPEDLAQKLSSFSLAHLPQATECSPEKFAQELTSLSLKTPPTPVGGSTLAAPLLEEKTETIIMETHSKVAEILFGPTNTVTASEPHNYCSQGAYSASTIENLSSITASQSQRYPNGSSFLTFAISKSHPCGHADFTIANFAHYDEGSVFTSPKIASLWSCPMKHPRNQRAIILEYNNIHTKLFTYTQATRHQWPQLIKTDVSPGVSRIDVRLHIADTPIFISAPPSQALFPSLHYNGQNYTLFPCIQRPIAFTLPVTQVSTSHSFTEIMKTPPLCRGTSGTFKAHLSITQAAYKIDIIIQAPIHSTWSKHTPTCLATCNYTVSLPDNTKKTYSTNLFGSTSACSDPHSKLQKCTNLIHANHEGSSHCVGFFTTTLPQTTSQTSVTTFTIDNSPHRAVQCIIRSQKGRKNAPAMLSITASANGLTIAQPAAPYSQKIFFNYPTKTFCRL